MVPSGEASNSALRSSIAKYGTNSYYYAHAPSRSSTVDASEAKVIEGPGIVTGGAPILIAKSEVSTDRETPLDIKTIAESIANGKTIRETRKIVTYSWCDKKQLVKIYIPLEDVEKLGASSPLNDDDIASHFEYESLALVIRTKGTPLVFQITKTYNPLNIQECSVTRTDRQIVISLVKDESDFTWFSLTKSS